MNCPLCGTADAQPFFWLALSSDNFDLMQLSDVADRVVKARLQSLPGVGSAGIFGERRYAMRVWVQPDALSARGLTVQDVQQAIRTRNVEVPAGRIESNRREFTVRSLGELKTIGEITIGCALGYLDFRYANEPWRPGHPKLEVWYAKVVKLAPLADTMPVG